ncbi:hypothetical protein K1X84_12890 [bacterium]|nr:hypothetical protein [bacterium]
MQSRKILIINPPKEFIKILGKLAYDTKSTASGKYDFILVFATKQAELEKLLKSHAPAGKYDCLF